MKLIILAAGRGTRFYPTTKIIPKALVRVGDKPLIEHVLKPFIGLVDKIIIVANDETGSLLEAYLGTNYFGTPVVYTTQALSGKKGTWPSMLRGVELLDTTDDYFIVTNCDDIFDANEMKKVLHAVPVLSMGVSRTIMPKKYMGMKVLDGYISGTASNMKALTDTVSDLFCNGFHILPRKILELDEVEIADGEFGLPQVIFKNLDTFPCKAIELNYWKSVNKPEDINKIV